MAESPLVRGPPYVRFCAACPVMKADDNTRSGVLCLIDTKPRELTASQYACFCLSAVQVSEPGELQPARGVSMHDH
jgi:hypothetical protein